MRLTTLTPDTATGNALKALKSPVGHMTPFRVLAHTEGNVLPVMKLGGAILADQKLSARLRELMVPGALALDGGRYEWPQHVDIAREVGLDAATIEAIERLDFDAGDLEQCERDLLAFTRSVVRDVRVDESIFAAARTWLDEREVVESLIPIGFYMMVARLTEACDIDADPVQGRAVVASIKPRPTTGE